MAHRGYKAVQGAVSIGSQFHRRGLNAVTKARPVLRSRSATQRVAPGSRTGRACAPGAAPGVHATRASARAWWRRLRLVASSAAWRRGAGGKRRAGAVAAALRRASTAPRAPSAKREYGGARAGREQCRPAPASPRWVGGWSGASAAAGTPALRVALARALTDPRRPCLLASARARTVAHTTWTLCQAPSAPHRSLHPTAPSRRALDITLV